MVKEIKSNDKGTKFELLSEAVDESAEIDEELGHKPFLQWTTKNQGKEDEYFEAIGEDGTVYTVVEDKPPTPPKQYKVVIE